jgi:hypothetical protein
VLFAHLIVHNGGRLSQHNKGITITVKALKLSQNEKRKNRKLVVEEK